MTHRFVLIWAGLLGATGVLLGAFGAHAMHGLLTAAGMGQVWETAVHYQLAHAVALLGLAGWMRAGPPGLPVGRAAWAARGWIAGSLLFSGSLYLLALGAPRWMGAVTPLGGACLIAGWIAAAAAAARA
jgi:uncharacterized membrane protein YgdD (TMEM256/DUF423 family)